MVCWTAGNDLADKNAPAIAHLPQPHRSRKQSANVPTATGFLHIRGVRLDQSEILAPFSSYQHTARRYLSEALETAAPGERPLFLR